MVEALTLLGYLLLGLAVGFIFFTILTFFVGDGDDE